MKRLAIIGAGGHGKVVADCAEKADEYDEIFFIDAIYPNTTQVLHWHIKASSEDWQKYINSADFVVAIGNNETRLRLTKELIERNANVVSIIHPSAQVSSYSTIGQGTVIFANAVINCSTELGIANIINTSATVDHDCKIGDGSHVCPGAHIAGGVNLGKHCWVGIASAIIQCVNITNNVTIGAQACVLNNISASGTYVGTPTQKIK
ncbi:acetyltransferase [Thalassotalea atypica]|uniref:acetyltransferase n=1 Tax=Thalassotalea atypica TaxID=2054316 RepID=UPI002572FDB4|nr:acetyltransferase [Thalassotalea atypica]